MTTQGAWIKIAELFEAHTPLCGICREIELLLVSKEILYSQFDFMNKQLVDWRDEYDKKGFLFIFPTKGTPDFKIEYDNQRAEICRTLAEESKNL